MTLKDLYLEGETLLEEAGITESSLDARLLLLEAFSIDLNAYLADRGSELAEDEDTLEKTARYRDFLKSRAQRMPLQLIVGSTEFMGLKFSVKENVFIPRQDTEALVEYVLADRKKGSLLDLCTGSGCIALSLAVKGDFSRIAATDISADALSAAYENAAALNLDTIEFYQGDLFSALPPETPPFSVITANPPYIPTDVIATLAPEVRDHEPMPALDGSADGLMFYRRIAAEARPYLARGGHIYMEIGFDQGPAVSEIFRSAGFDNVMVFPDLTGNDRVAVAGGPCDQGPMGGSIDV